MKFTINNIKYTVILGKDILSNCFYYGFKHLWLVEKFYGSFNVCILYASNISKEYINFLEYYTCIRHGIFQ